MSAGLDCIRDCIFWHFYPQLWNLFLRMSFYTVFLMVWTTSYLSGFTFCPLVVFTAGTCWYRYPAFFLRWSNCHCIVITFFGLLFHSIEKKKTKKTNCCFENVLQTSVPKLVYTNILDFLMLFCYIGDEELVSSTAFHEILNHVKKTGHPLMVNALFTSGPAQCVLVKKEEGEENMKLFCCIIDVSLALIETWPGVAAITDWCHFK